MAARRLPDNRAVTWVCTSDPAVQSALTYTYGLAIHAHGLCDYMSRLSFRSTLLASFLLIAGALAAAAVSGWLSLEALARAIHDGNRKALALNAAARQLGERVTDLERSARQYLVLGDPALAARFHEALSEASSALAVLESADPDYSASISDWRDTAADIGRHLANAPPTATDLDAAGAPTPAAPLSESELSARFSKLTTLSEILAGRVQQDLSRRNGELLVALDQQRDRLALQILAALVLAGGLAGLTAWWLLRPLTRIEQAIAELGESRLGTPIRIGGPVDLRQLGERLDWLRLRLADLEANRNRVLRHVSHELKTPLASLREGVALLGDGVLGRLSAEQREVAGILDHSARALQERIEQLLDYNASQFDARRLDRQPTALLPLLREVASEHQLVAQSRSLSLSVDGDAPIVAADAGKLRIALSNLLANAIAFSPIEGKVRLEIRAQGDEVVIDCFDDGPGVAEDELERIFDPFFQGSRSAHGPLKGSGIGLAIVREFIAAHAGRVRALPIERGAHFRVELPHAE